MLVGRLLSTTWPPLSANSVATETGGEADRKENSRSLSVDHLKGQAFICYKRLLGFACKDVGVCVSSVETFIQPLS